MVPIRSYQHGNDQIDVGAGPICNCVVRDQRLALPAISAWRFQGKGIWNLARAVMIAPIEKQISAQLARKISASPATISVVRPTMQARASTTLGARCIIFTR